MTSPVSPESNESFDSHRGPLFGVAYRMLGDAAEAEDVVQEAFLRIHDGPLSAQATGPIRSMRAYLTTIVSRLCLDRLKSARARRESYVGPWLPEPIRTDTTVDPESISLAFLVLLESLTPQERAVLLLHEVFDYSHAEVAEMLALEETACRQLLHRAREQVKARRRRFPGTREAQERLLASFVQACAVGDLSGLRALLAADVTFWSDGGGKVKAALRPVHGADSVSRMVIGLAKKKVDDLRLELAEINGGPAVILRSGETITDVLSIETDGTVITEIRFVRNPDKLRHV